MKYLISMAAIMCMAGLAQAQACPDGKCPVAKVAVKKAAETVKTTTKTAVTTVQTVNGYARMPLANGPVRAVAAGHPVRSFVCDVTCRVRHFMHR